MALWGEAHGWRYEIFPLDISDRAALGDMTDFKHLWDSKRNGDLLPAWKDFELEDLIKWHGWIDVEDIIPGPVYASKMRLFGTNLVSLYGIDLTGQLTRDHLGTILSIEDFQMCREMVEQKKFRLCRGPLDWKHDFLWNTATQYEFIQLPLADDGKTIDKMIEMVRLLEEGEEAEEP